VVISSIINKHPKSSEQREPTKNLITSPELSFIAMPNIPSPCSVVPVLVNHSVRVLSEELVTEAALPLPLSEMYHFDVPTQGCPAAEDLAAGLTDVTDFLSCNG
jgi:hypothetical protein